jgi:hypothetical protein
MNEENQERLRAMIREELDSREFRIEPLKIPCAFLIIITYRHILHLAMVLFGIAEGLDVKGSRWMRFRSCTGRTPVKKQL